MVYRKMSCIFYALTHIYREYDKFLEHDFPKEETSLVIFSEKSHPIIVKIARNALTGVTEFIYCEHCALLCKMLSLIYIYVFKDYKEILMQLHLRREETFLTGYALRDNHFK